MEIRRIWATELTCPRCDKKHYFEASVPIEVLPPDKLGLGTLCGSCEAMRLCYLVGDGKTRPFWHKAEESRIWGRIKHRPERYQQTAWEAEPHDQPLRDDQHAEALRLIGVKPEKPWYQTIYRLRWTMDAMREKGINWPIPPATEEF